MLHASTLQCDGGITCQGSDLSPLTPIERQVVLLSLADGLHTIVKAAPLRRLCQRMFWRRRTNRLADPRLEALRVFCVRYRLDREAFDWGALRTPESGSAIPLEMMLAAATLINSCQRWEKS